ncbi:hypothetical protein ACUY3K_03375 [Corynebacterium uberis]|uniref:hypothetical protein n=1 Tax=Corynebacterium TaxID=1716 RepID=UPI001D09C77A|nr:MULTISPECIES: hypothetical protein [Corynebacterium]MCZ9309368.1 hypothetical protein [Corynebacterium sp. c6VSa_13]UDL72917.1 hypothetical protein LH391_07285 [Corynebacterium uberis]UDL76206.1 hypothetical protein LH393_02105 [Corynebacterium uberis]UDL78418.1 hypothetical protein LH394_02100 [Corynebacterium uberis]UDL80701.1 hypothetical protein LH392_02530 [Corynebacterium uberis]
MSTKKLSIAAACAVAASALVGPAVAQGATQDDACTVYRESNYVKATCTNDTDSPKTINLYVNCQPNPITKPRSTKPIAAHQTESLSTVCGGWSTVQGAYANLS